MENQAALTHEEIWDDSALVESWNSALEEYKKYHSIHAKGGTVDDLSPSPNRHDDGQEAAASQDDLKEEGEADDEVMVDQASSEANKRAPPSITGAGTAVPSAPPQGLLGSVQDEGMKRLLMSWYYAGYYTGLYEGQQKAQQDAAASPRTG